MTTKPIEFKLTLTVSSSVKFNPASFNLIIAEEVLPLSQTFPSASSAIS